MKDPERERKSNDRLTREREAYREKETKRHR